MPGLIDLEDVSKVYRAGELDVPALRGVDLEVPSGDYVAIMGPSGSGKSTLMHIVGCLDTPSAGRYRLSDHDVSALPERALSPIRRRYIGLVFQSFNLIGSLTAVDNVALPLVYLGRSPREQRAGAEAALGAVGLGDRLLHRPSQLSGGQQQRVAIARAVVAEAPILLADEPTGNLDSHAGQEIMAILDRLHAAGKTIVVITHDADVARRAGRVIEMRDGRIVRDGGHST